MYCPKCGSKNSDLSHYCKTCGKKIEDITKINNTFDDYSYEYNNITDEDLQKEYIGPNYKKINNNSFSIPAFIFESYYFIYRKMWLYGIILLAIKISIGLLFKDNCIIPSLIINLLVGFNFNQIYISNASKKIEKIKIKNQDKTNKEIKKICKKNGGVSIVSVVIYVITIFIITLNAALMLIATNIIKSNKFKSNNNKTKTNTIGNLTYNLPEGYKITTTDTEYYKRYSLKEDFKYCSFTIELVKSDIKAEDYLNNKIYINPGDKANNIMPIKINGFEWSYLVIERSTKINYYYVVSYNDNLYKIEYNTKKDTRECLNSYERLIASLEFIDFEVSKI